MRPSNEWPLDLRDDVQVMVLPRTPGWRTEPGTRRLLQSTASAAARGLRFTLEDRDGLVSELLMPGRFVVQGDWDGRRLALGVSASHEGRHTYVACALGPVVIDACALRRWPEVQRAADVAFTRSERELITHPWDWCRAWTALECLAKHQGTSLHSSAGRGPLLQRAPTGGVDFGDVWHVSHPQSATSVRNRVCLGILTSPPPATSQGQ